MPDNGGNSGGMRFVGDHEDRLAEVAVPSAGDGEDLVRRFGLATSGRSVGEQEGWTDHT